MVLGSGRSRGLLLRNGFVLPLHRSLSAEPPPELAGRLRASRKFIFILAHLEGLVKKEIAMAIKARIGDVELEIESEADLRMLMSVVRVGAVPMQPALLSETLGDKLKRFLKRVKKQEQRRILMALADSAEGLTDAELRARVGAKSNTVLAGYMSGLSKNATASGLRLEHVVVKHPLAVQSSNGMYQYRLTPEMREVIRGKQT